MPKAYDYIITDCKDADLTTSAVLDNVKQIKESDFNEKDLTVNGINNKFSNTENKSDTESIIILSDRYTATKILRA